MNGRFDILVISTIAAMILALLPIQIAAQPSESRFGQPALNVDLADSKRPDKATGNSSSAGHRLDSRRASNQQLIWAILSLYILALLIAIVAYRWRHLRDKAHQSEVAHERAINRRLKAADAAKEQLIAELEAKNAELERFTYTVSHDLKTPLVTIQGFLSFIRRDAVSGNLERLEEDIGRINGAVGKMRGLLEELLDLSRIGRVMNAPQKVPLGDLVHEASELLAGRISESGAEIRVLTELPVVIGDRARLFQVVQNLIDNALKYSDQPPRIEIGRCEPATKDESDGKLDNGSPSPVVFISDQGLGIEPKHLEDVFGLFRQLDPGYEGTGIGLALVQRIVELHQGQIWAESEGLGHGSTFFFSLPSAAGQDTADAVT